MKTGKLKTVGLKELITKAAKKVIASSANCHTSEECHVIPDSSSLDCHRASRNVEPSCHTESSSCH